MRQSGDHAKCQFGRKSVSVPADSLYQMRRNVVHRLTRSEHKRIEVLRGVYRRRMDTVVAARVTYFPVERDDRYDADNGAQQEQDIIA